MMEEPTAHPEQAASAKQGLVASVQFAPADKIYTFTTDDASLARGDRVMVEVEGGTAIAVVSIPPHEAATGAIPSDAKRIVRRATPEDIDAAAELCDKALECFEVCRDRIHWRNLPMKLVDAELVEGGRKVIFTFFAEQRVDFRALVKELAATLRLRIEMRQVGSRDESKLVGCMGSCGLTTCCSTHLRQFQSISISMAKHQGLAPNPAKLTGMCGKLKCCLAYEIAAYDECRHGLPKVGAAVETPEGAGKVAGHNVLKRECQVRLYAGGEVRCPCEQCRLLTNEERERAITAMREAQEQAEERFRARRQGRPDRKSGRSERPEGSRAEQPPRERGPSTNASGHSERPSSERPAGGDAERPAGERIEQPSATGSAESAKGSSAQQTSGRGPSTTASGHGERPAGERKEGHHGRRRRRRSGKR